MRALFLRSAHGIIIESAHANDGMLMCMCARPSRSVCSARACGMHIHNIYSCLGFFRACAARACVHAVAYSRARGAFCAQYCYGMVYTLNTLIHTNSLERMRPRGMPVSMYYHVCARQSRVVMETHTIIIIVAVAMDVVVVCAPFDNTATRAIARRWLVSHHQFANPPLTSL